MIVKWYGTASVSFETEQSRILFDPFVPIMGSKVRINKKDFSGYSDIFITHGHLDHILSIPKLIKGGILSDNATIHCTKTPSNTLIKKGVREERIHGIKPGDRISSGEFEIEALKGKHIHFDKEIIRRTLLSPRILQYIYNVPGLFIENKICKENDETLAYVIKAEGRTILLLGSIGLREGVDYPAGVDLLVLPFQGATDLITPAMGVIEKIRPGSILLDHFDDTFPPISNSVCVNEFKNRMALSHPEIKLIVPEYKAPILL
ncbi:MAG: MBL fold metallo-hydrolase [Eubacteriales bacterium]|nr:MBL fold metallo-hydrolase [Eubacteriales bacterium]